MPSPYGKQRKDKKTANREERARYSYEHLVEAEKIAHFGSWSWDLRKDVALWSDEMYAIFGRDKTFVPNLENSLQCIHPEDRGRVQAAVESAIKKKELYDTEYRVLQPNGSIRHVHARGRAEYDRSGKPTHMIGTVHDITGDKLAEKELYDQKRLMEETQAFGHIGSWEINLLTGKQHGTEENHRLYNMAPGESETEENVLRHIHPDDHPTVSKTLKIAAEKGSASAEVRILLGEKKIRWLSCKAVARYDETGKPVRIIGINQDITEHKRLEYLQKENEQRLRDATLELERRVKERTDELRKANEDLKLLDKQKTLFISMFSHELKTPLVPIMGYIEMIANGEYGNVTKEQKEKLAVCYRNAINLRQLVNDLTDLSRLDLEQMNIQIKIEDLADIAKKAKADLETMAKEYNASIFLKCPKKVFLSCDKQRIEEVFTNLLKNAIQYGRKGKKNHIEMRIREKRTTILIEIEDQGQGIPKEAMKKIFNRFERAQQAVRSPTTGTGLGLFIVKGIVQLHGGFVSLKSKEGEGTTFRIVFPKRVRLRKEKENSYEVLENGKNSTRR